ncbi:hypothetical protein N9732_00920 [Polaribacter sp.]|nr:hypothetical protein [Polaribacter sp.]
MVNNINLADEGGMVWIKDRTEAYSHSLIDTERGNTKRLKSDSTAAENDTGTIGLLAFNTDGFELGTGGGAMWGRDTGNNEVATWTFRKAEKFFDVVTYTGNDTSGRQIAHNLGSVPACMIVKKTSGTYNWQIYHSSIGATKFLEFTNYLAQTSSAVWDDTAPTDSVFTVGNEYGVNQSGDTYVAYLFASDAGGFGDDGSESIIKCGSYTGNNSSAGPTIDLGFEPQWVLIKQSSAAGENWVVADNMRGVATGGNDAYLFPNTSNSESSTGARDFIEFNATGFTLKNNYGFTNASATYIYIAIRRPMKTPESGTEVFAVDEADSGTNPNFYSGFPVDVSIRKYLTNSTQSPELETRLTNKKLETAQTAAENATDPGWWDWQDGVSSSGHGPGTFAWMFKRATGFFDVVAYTGNGVGGRAVAHNLGVAPELMIVKRRDSSESWSVYSAYNGLGFLFLNTTSAYNSANIFWNNTSPSNSTFTVSADGGVNVSGGTYIAYLFGSVAGVSKVGSYTGDGTTDGSNVIDCGFSAGARFILIKRTDSTGSWLLMDSVRGITTSNDPILKLNSTGLQQLGNSVHPAASGFGVVEAGGSNANTNGANYIFLAIA